MKQKLFILLAVFCSAIMLQAKTTLLPVKDGIPPKSRIVQRVPKARPNAQKASSTSGTCGENLNWSYDAASGTLTITGTGAMDDYEDLYDESEEWIGCATPWYEYAPQILSVSLPEGLTSIGNLAFADFTALTNITIPNSVASIGMYAFAGCSGLTRVTIPNSVTSIEYGAFAYCSGLTSITIPNSVTSIEYGAFAYCSGLTRVTIPNSVTTIGDYAFGGVTNIEYYGSASGAPWGAKSMNGFVEGWLVYSDETKTHLLACATSAKGEINILNSVTSIGDEAFRDCINLTSVTIPNSVTEIGYAAFSGCIGLISVTIPNTVTTIGDYAFGGVINIEYYGNASGAPWEAISMNGFVEGWLVYSDETKTHLLACATSAKGEICIPNSVTNIDEGAFSGCSSLTSITISNSVTSIGQETFYGCSGLTSITIPNSVTNIDWGAFRDCSGLTNVTIPNSVTSIGSYAFAGCSGLTSVIISNSANRIGDCTFANCTSLTSIIIPNSVTSIGNNAFSKCLGLTCVTIGNSVTSIGNSAFLDCTGLTSLNIGNNVTSIGESAFSKCPGLTSVTINSNNIVNKTYSSSSNLKTIFGEQVTEYKLGEGITGIGNYAFYQSTGLASIKIPDNVINIGEYAFSGCSGLRNVTIGSNVTNIGNRAFYGCTGLTSVTIPNSVTSIGSYAFAGCSGLTSVIISNSANRIRDYTFANCTSLTSIIIPNSVTSIGNNAFSKCLSLTSVTIGNSVTSIGNSAFSDCTGLTSVTLNSNTLVSKTYTSSSNLKNIFGKQVAEYILRDDITSIGDYAFYNCSGLTSVTIGNSVTSIGNYAFSDCTSLTSVHISDLAAWCGITFNSAQSNPLYHAGHLYLNSTEIKDLVVPNSITNIGEYTFRGCSGLTSITIPNSVTSIGMLAFYGCTGLTSISVGSSVTNIGDHAFFGCSGLTTVTINSNDIVNKSYSSSSNLKNIFGEQVTEYILGEGITGIGSYAFYQCAGITSLTLPHSITSIGNSVFYGCSSLKNVTIGNNVVSIGSSAFKGCFGLTSIEIPNSVTSIGESAFSKCPGLTSVTINSNNIVNKTYSSSSNLKTIFGEQVTEYKLGEGITGIGNYAFYQSTGLASIKIPDNVVNIGEYAFSGCSGLRNVTIGSNVTNIGNRAFYGCTDLTSVVWNAKNCANNGGFGDQVESFTFGNEVESIPASCCEEMSKLTEVTIPNSVTSIGSSAFYGCKGLTSVHISDLAAWCHTTCSSNVSNPLYYAHHLYLNNTEITVLTIPNSVTSIGNYAFNGCTNITSATIPNSVASIGDYAFNGCIGLTSVTVGNNVTSIGNTAFGGCSGLKSIILPHSVTSIGHGAFSDCSGLTSFDIPDGVIGLGQYIFSGCTSLEAISIPKSVNTIIPQYQGYDISPFTGINIDSQSGLPMEGALTAFIVDPENPIFTAKDGVLYNKNMTKLIQFPCAKKDAYTIPESVIYIEDYAFYGNQILTELNLPRNVRVIEDGAFAYMVNLKTLHLPEELVKIGVAGFLGCCDIEDLTFGSKLKSIGNQAFTLNINKCKSITCFANQVPTLETEYVGAITVGKSTGYIWENWEEVPPSALTVYVPQASIGDYIMDENWGQFTILPITAQQTNVEDLIVVPSTNTVDCSWPAVSGAVTYELVIKDKSGNLICTLIFNAQGQLTQIAFNAPARDNAPEQTQSAGFHFTVTGLNSGTGYDLSLTAKNESGQEIDKKNVSFHTDTTQGIEDLHVDAAKAVKVLHNGQIYILRGDHIFDAQGKMIK